MRNIWQPLIAALLTAIVVSIGVVKAQPFGPIREKLVGESIAATATNSAFWTGWIEVDDFRSLHVELTAVDANDSVDNFNIRCEESNSSSTAADAGADLCCRSISGGTETYSCPCTKKHDPTNGAKYSVTFESLHQKYVNCNIDAEGTPAAADTMALEFFGER